MEAWPGGQLEGHVGPGGEGASGWPHPFPLAPEQLLCARYPWQLCQAPRAPSPSSPSAQGLAFTGCCGGCQCLYPPTLGNFLELREPAQKCQGGVPGEPACVLWACSSPSLPARSICTGIWGWVCVCCCLSQSSYYG